MLTAMKKIAVSTLSSYPHLLDWTRRIYCAIGLGTRTERDFLFLLARKQKHVFVLQVGANDGVTNDPIHPFVDEYRWKGLLLEPLSDIFEKLQQNYKGEAGIELCNAAMADQNGSMTFYRVTGGAEVPEWCDRIGSFSRETVLSHKHRFPAIERYITEQAVDVLSFNTLVDRYSIQGIDVVMIDAEGYDYEILQQIDLVRFRPKLVVYEQIHLSKAVKKASVDLLNRAGYDVHNSYNMNFVGVRR